jgi:Alpha-L-arabinofuranosidase B (ABFB) domain/Extracellular link domain
MGNEVLIIALIVLVVVFVFVLPMVNKKRAEGFEGGSGIDAYDNLGGDPISYGTLLQKKYNRMSDTLDVTKRNFMNAETQPEIDLASEQIKTALRTTNLEVDPSSKTLIGTNPDVPPETLAPINQIVLEAKKCEALNSRSNCATLDDPNFQNCGICVKDRTTMFKPADGADPWKHGGLLMIPEDKKKAEMEQQGRPGPVQYSPTVGDCPPGYFFVDRASCEKKSNQLDCAEAGENGGFNGGLTSEKQKVIGSKCANVPVSGADKFIYDTRDRRFNVNLRVLAPSGTGITKVFVTDKASGAQIGYAMSDTPGVEFVVTVNNVVEGQQVNVSVEQEAPYRSAAGKSEVFAYVYENNKNYNWAYNQTIDSSKKICERIGARLATEGELEQSQSDGAQFCGCGNTTSTSAYPAQAFLKDGGCGNKGVNQCGWTQGKGHSWCYGIKPPQSNNLQTFFAYVANWFNTYGSKSNPDQSNMPSIWSKWGPDYQAQFERGVVMQWEHEKDPKRMAQAFEPSITAVNDMGPNTITTETLSIKTFKLLRRMGTFKSSAIIKSPRPSKGSPMLTNQFWIWGNQAKNAFVKFTAAIPGTFLTPVYKEDNKVASRGQLILNKETFNYMQVNPCLKDGQNPGAYSIDCLATLFAGAGGDLRAGKLALLGDVDPYSGNSGRGLMDLNKRGDMDTISAYLTKLYTIATTGRDENGMRVGGTNGKERAKKINKAAQLMFGFDITSPCEDVEEDSQGNIVIVPRTGALDADCLQYLWMNAGTDKTRGNEESSRFAYPHRGGVSATYTRIEDRFSGLLNTEGTPKKRELNPFQTCQPSGAMAPVGANGKPIAQNISIANSKGGITAVQNFYDKIHKDANYSPSSTDKDAMAAHATAVQQCYGTTKAVSIEKQTGCGVAARYVVILPTGIYPAWQNWNMCIMLPQVQVFNGDGIEIAKGKRTQAATRWPWDSENVVGSAVAVNGNAYPHSHGEGEYHDDCSSPDLQYWLVDLGSMVEVSQVKVYMRTDCCQGRYIAMPIQLRDQSNNIICQKNLGQGQWPDNPDNTYTVSFTADDVKPAFKAADIKPGIVISLLNAISWDRVLRHSGFAGWVHGPDQGPNNGYSPLESRDASFRIQPGRNGKADYISFESINYPGYYLRHSGFRIWLHWPDGSGLFNEDSSFKPIPAINSDATMVSFQSANFPEYYLSAHRDMPDQAWITKTNGIHAGWDNQHHSWRIIAALSTS